jgi:predicted SnoaL-like aldol condensation-catalyzing enzyme
MFIGRPYRAGTYPRTMSTEENKAIAQRVYDAINARDRDALSTLLAEDLASQTPFPEGPGRTGFLALYDEVVAQYPDYRVEVQDQIAEGDRVVTRYTATGVDEGVDLIGIDIDRVADGRIVEHWSEAGPAHLAARRGVVMPR